MMLYQRRKTSKVDSHELVKLQAGYNRRYLHLGLVRGANDFDIDEIYVIHHDQTALEET